MLRKITSLIAMLVVCLVVTTNVSAQALNRSVAVTSGTYNEIAGTVIWNNTTSLWSNSNATMTLPFNVLFAGTTYSTIYINGGGVVSFGGTTGSSTPLTSGFPAVSAFGNLLTPAGGGNVSYIVTGTSPNRVLTIQWKNATRYYADNIGRDVYNFQIKVYEANATSVDGSRIDVVYGPMTVNAPNNIIVGATNGTTETLALNVGQYYSSWSRPQVVAANTISNISQQVAPASGTTVTFRNRVAPYHNNDAGIRGLVTPTKFAAGTAQTVAVTVRNWGTNNLDSVVIDWTVDGVTQTPLRYYPQPALAPGQESNVTLGTVNFTANTLSTISVTTLSPNGVADVNSGNDRMIVEVGPRMTGNFVVSQNGNPNAYNGFYSFMRQLANAGIANDVNVEVQAGTYAGELIVPAIDATAGRVTIQRRAGDKVTLTDKVFPAYTNYNSFEAHTIARVMGGGSNVTFRDLAFETDATSSFLSVFASDNATNVILDKCSFTGNDFYPSMSINYPGVLVQNLVVPSTNQVTNCTFTKLYEGLRITSATGARDVASTNTFTNCRLAINASNGSPVITGNNITTCDCSAGVQAITLANTANAVVTANRVNSTLTTGVSWGLYATGNNNSLVANNMFAASGTTQVIGIYTTANSGTSNMFAHNSVNISGSPTTASAFYVANNGGTVNGVNNIFQNYGTGSNGSYAVWVSPTTTNPLGTWDFNNLMTTGTYVANWGGSLITRVAGSNPLSTWKATTVKDQNSASVLTNFAGGTDLHLLSIQRELFGSSTMLSIVPTDIDGETRTKPYMGSDEIRPTIAMVRQPASAYVCVGGIDTLIAIADVTPGATATYQWFKDGVELTGQTGNIVVLTNVQYSTSGVYTCLIKANDGTNFVQLASDGASIMVVRPTQITEQPASKPVADGGTFNLTVSAEAIGAPTNFVPAYQWMKRYWNPVTLTYENTPINDDGRITGAQSSMLTVRNAGTADTTGTYVCEVTGYCGSVLSKAARVFIPLVAVSNMVPNLCEGGTLELGLRANPTVLPEGKAEFSWYRNGSKIEGQTGAALTIKNFSAADNGTYTCVMSFGSKDLTFTSNEVVVKAGTAPVFTRQPEAQSVCEGKLMTLTAAASGDDVQYQWMKGTQVLANEINSTLSRIASDVDGGSYSVVITNTCGTKTSTPVDVAVEPLPKISTQPADVQFTAMSTLTMSVVAAGRNIYNYQWYVNDVAIPGATNATLEIKNASVANAGTYYCEITNLCGSVKSRNAMASITTGVTDDVVAGGYLLSTAFPNPTYDASSITYAVPATQNVRIAVTDLMGRELGVLVNDVADAGSHVVKFRAGEFNLNAGVYNVTLTAGGFVATQQIVVVK